MLFSVIKSNTYQDSLRLIRLSNLLAGTDGVRNVSVMMGTDLNKDMLDKAGMLTGEIASTTPNDLVVTAEVPDDATRHALVETVDAYLSQATQRSTGGRRVPTARSFQSALKAIPDANIGIVSIPGQYAADEARRLLDHGINVFLFSDNVSVEDEIALKQAARAAGLIVMGPDCGTGYIAGVPLGFANAVRHGTIGLAAASGTGSQDVMVQISDLGGGISHAMGLGGRDLSAAVGGIACEQALHALDADPGTDVIVLVSKPPSAEVRTTILGIARTLATPVVAIMAGARADHHEGIWFARTLDDGARLAVELAGAAPSRPPRLRHDQRLIKGMFTGGTLAAEAAQLIASGLGLPPPSRHDDGFLLHSGGHDIVDLGDDAYTRGRPHPMIEPSVRNEKVIDAISDPRTAVVLLDVVLGYGSHDDPAGVLAPAVTGALAAAAEQGREVAVVATLCGTADDRQDRAAQRRTLTDAGIVVMPSTASAARYACHVATRRARRSADTEPSDPIAATLLGHRPRVINIGLREFTEALSDRNVSAVQYDWRPAAGGDQHLQDLLAALR